MAQTATKEKHKQKPRNWCNLITKLTIIPLAIASYFAFLFALLNFASACTGTSSAWFSTHAICQEVGDTWMAFDIFFFSPMLIIIWFFIPYKRYGHLTRIFILLYLFGGRIAILYLLTLWQVVPVAIG